MKRNLSDIQPIQTSHNVGEKRVLLAAKESGCGLTQIAVTDLRAGEVATAHIHPDMQEGFYVLNGELEITLDGDTQRCKAEDFIYVQSGTSHELHALTDVRIMTIGCVVETMQEMVYPMMFEPNMHPVVWGGDRLSPWKGVNVDTRIGESWEVSAIPTSPSIISNGTWTGYNLIDVIAHNPKAILGKKVAERYNNQLPLLAKFIDADSDLSIQVHPDDEMAKRVHGKLGKSEMWYVLDAKPGAYLYAGFKQALSPEQYKRMVVDGTITEALAKHEVHKGDVFYLPAGRVHAIGAGILLAEIQQSSDVTYRIFDYNRLGLDGAPRELHTDLAAEALDYNVLAEYRTEYDDKSDAVNRCLQTPFFSIAIVDTAVPKHRDLVKYDSFIIVMCTEGECKISIRSTKGEITLCEGNSCLVPAVIADYDIIPQNGSVRLLEAYIDNKPTSAIGELISKFTHFRF